MAIEQDIPKIVSDQRRFFNSMATRPHEFRIKALDTLKKGIIKFESRLTQALSRDLGKPEFESYASETGFVLSDLTHTVKKLNTWMKPKRVSTPMLCQPGSSRILYSPLGVNLIISPFNYPVGLTFAPLAAAIAAGNTAVIKASELTPHCSRVIQELIEDSFPGEYIAYVPGEVPETTRLLEEKFDHIFFTGSPRVGSIVMAAAARHLTPVTLELGGKSPCIVHSDARMQIAARRIVFGKFFNTGQTCVAPDYVLVHENVKEPFIEALKARIQEVYGKDPFLSPDYGRIVNLGHFDRIAGLIDQEKVVAGGLTSRKEKYISPTVMADVTLEDRVMTQEIFGPVLPVMTYEGLDQVFDVIARLPQHPLACYVFTQDRQVQKELTTRIQFGGGCINHCIQHLVNPNLPFGGVGQSGMGSYHGFSGFECFSHKKSLLKASTRMDLPLAYPPYRKKLGLVRRLMK